LKFHHTRRCEYDFCKIYVHHNYSTYYDEVLCTRISKTISNLCNYTFVKLKNVDEKKASHTQFWLIVIHVRSWSTRRNRDRASSLRAPSQMYLETDSNSIENKRVSRLTISKNLCRTFRRGRSDYNATHIFFSFLGMKVELEKRLRKPLESGEDQMQRTCVCSFAGCNFAVRRDTVCSRRSVCVRDEHAEGARGRRSHLLRNVSPRTAETYAETPSAL